eukprot:PhM_4_TR2441/c0_g1_i1/m.14257/K14786/KRI1; protein KRI1
MNLLDDDDVETGIEINPEFAQQFKERKQRQELRHLREKYGSDYEDSEEGVEEDEEAELFTEDKRKAFEDTLYAIRAGVPIDKDTAFWQDDEDDDGDEGETKVPQRRSEEPLTLKKQMTQLALKEGTNVITSHVDDPMFRSSTMTSNAKEASTSKAQFLKAMAGVEDDIGELQHIGVRESTKQQLSENGPSMTAATTSVQGTTSSKPSKVFEVEDTDTPEERFLKEYFRLEGWKDGHLVKNKKKAKAVSKTAEPAVAVGDGEVDDDGDDAEDFFDRAEEYEQQYQATQYKHEEGDHALAIQSFPRAAGTFRDTTTSRQLARDRKKERLEQAEREEQEELKRLKKLKRDDIDRRLTAIKKIGGSEHLGIDKDFLLRDFDEKDWDSQMMALFGDDYYGEDDEAVHPDDEDDLMGGPGGVSSVDADLELLYPTANVVDDGEDGNRPTSTKQRRDQELADEIAQLKKDLAVYHEYEDEDDGDDVTPADADGKKKKKKRRRFQYTEVSTDDIPLDPVDILTMDDRVLNDIAPLRFYAPYTTPKERRKFKYRTLEKLKLVRGHTTAGDDWGQGRGGGAEPVDDASSSKFRSSRKYRTDSVVMRQGEEAVWQEKQKELQKMNEEEEQRQNAAKQAKAKAVAGASSGRGIEEGRKAKKAKTVSH